MVRARTTIWWQRYIDMHLPMLVCILLLAGAGIAMQYSAAGGNMQPWAMPQLVRFIMGMVIFLMLVGMPLSWLMRLAYPAYFLALGLLILVEIIGDVGMGAQRWIDLGFIRIQPSEFMKPALIVALARYVHVVRHEDLSHPLMLVPALLMIAAPVMLVLYQPNLGTASIIAALGIGMLFLSGIKWQYFAAGIIALMVMLPIAWQSLHDYQQQRVLTFLDPSSDPLGSGYNIIQSVIAIGSGGLYGKGYLQGSQAQLDFLPEKQTDFIFTMVAEETGFVGCILLIAAFMLLLISGLVLCARAKSRFASMIAGGVSITLFLHVFINMAMVMGIVPVVGVPLPFLSYGGTFLLTTMILCGLLMQIFTQQDQALHRNIRAI